MADRKEVQPLVFEHSDQPLKNKFLAWAADRRLGGRLAAIIYIFFSFFV